MNPFDLAQAFIERCTSPRAEDLSGAFEQTLGILGFKYFACCSHVDPLHPPQQTVMVLNYPDSWVRCYSNDEVHQIDPVFQRAERALLPFTWDDEIFRGSLTPAQRRILDEAAQFGIAHGYTIPIHSPGAFGSNRASCTLIPDDRVIDPSNYFFVHLMAFYFYERLSRSATTTPVQHCIGLAPRERQCLELAAQGKTDWEIGKLLNIAERTVHNHIERAKRRLGVITRMQAVVHALAYQQFSFGDVVRIDRQQEGAPHSDTQPTARSLIGPIHVRHKSRQA